MARRCRVYRKFQFSATRCAPNEPRAQFIPDPWAKCKMKIRQKLFQTMKMAASGLPKRALGQKIAGNPAKG
jgi:hypothetical protein